MKKLLAMAALTACAAPLWATTQTVTLTKVSGVGKIDVNLDRREAKVTFDDVKTSAEALTRATKDAGYPASVVGTAK